MPVKTIQRSNYVDSRHERTHPKQLDRSLERHQRKRSLNRTNNSLNNGTNVVDEIDGNNHIRAAIEHN